MLLEVGGIRTMMPATSGSESTRDLSSIWGGESVTSGSGEHREGHCHKPRGETGGGRIQKSCLRYEDELDGDVWMDDGWSSGWEEGRRSWGIKGTGGKFSLELRRGIARYPRNTSGSFFVRLVGVLLVWRGRGNPEGGANKRCFQVSHPIQEGKRPQRAPLMRSSQQLHSHSMSD